MSTKSKERKAARLAEAAVSNAENKVVKSQKKEKRQDDANKASLTKKITEKKDLKYIYPEDCDSLPARKKFRAEARRKRNSMIAQLTKVRKGKVEGDVKSLVKEFNTWATGVFQEPALQEA